MTFVIRPILRNPPATMMAGGLKYDVISFATEDNVMFKLGNFDKSTKAKDLFKIISDHSAGSLDNIAYVSIGSTGNPSEPIERNIICKICNLIGSIDLYYDKDTFNYFFKPKNKWNTTYVQRIDCTSDFSYEKVLYNAEKYIKLEGK